MKCSLLIIMSFLLSGNLITAQGRPKQYAPPPPPPAPIPKSYNYDSGPPPGAGFKLVTIPVYQDIELGMRKTVFDSIAGKPFRFNTGTSEYDAVISPSFIGKRLFKLTFLIDTKNADIGMDELLKKYTGKYGKPDTTEAFGTVEPFSSSTDSTKKELLDVRNRSALWRFKYYDLLIREKVVQGKNEIRSGEMRVSFTGNDEYYQLLSDIEWREN